MADGPPRSCGCATAVRPACSSSAADRRRRAPRRGRPAAAAPARGAPLAGVGRLEGGCGGAAVNGVGHGNCAAVALLVRRARFARKISHRSRVLPLSHEFRRIDRPTVDDDVAPLGSVYGRRIRRSSLVHRSLTPPHQAPHLSLAQRLRRRQRLPLRRPRPRHHPSERHMLQGQPRPRDVGGGGLHSPSTPRAGATLVGAGGDLLLFGGRRDRPRSAAAAGRQRRGGAAQFGAILRRLSDPPSPSQVLADFWRLDPSDRWQPLLAPSAPRAPSTAPSTAPPAPARRTSTSTAARARAGCATTCGRGGRGRTPRCVPTAGAAGCGCRQAGSSSTAASTPVAFARRRAGCTRARSPAIRRG